MFRLVSAIVALLLCSSAMALAQNQPPSPSPREPEITTWGRGEVKLAPNYAYVLFGVATQSSSAVETASENARKIAAVLSALRALGLTDQQATTSGYTLNQTYEYPKHGPPKLTGFAARNTIRAEIRRLDDVGKVIDAAINAGATDVSSIQFLPSAMDDARRAALAEAVSQARGDADAMARAAGGSLGRLISIGSAGVSQPGTVYLQSAVVTSSGMASVPPGTPVVPGELSVVAQVFTRWEFVSGVSR